jgi:exodeoxyribonuclease VII large subunit
MQRSLAQWKHRLAMAAGKLEGVSPLATLARGFAAVANQQTGDPVRGVADIRAGATVVVRLLDGSFDAWVTEVRTEDQAAGKGARKKRR